MKRLIRGKPDPVSQLESLSLANDPRWQRLNDRNFVCPCCDQQFNGIFDIGFDHPDTWPHGNRFKSGLETLEIGRDSLGRDLCSIEEDRFIRCVLPIPILGCDETFSFGPWASVHPDNFELYRKDDAGEDGASFDGCFAWLMNDLPEMTGEDPVACNLVPQSGNLRPALYAHDGPLKKAQENGITFDELLDIYAASGNDLRPHLLQS